MSLSSFKKFSETSMILENTLNDMEKQFNEILSSIGGYMHVKFPLFKLPFDKLTICRVVDSPEEAGEQQDTKKMITIVNPEVKTMAVDAKGNVFINQKFAINLWQENKKHVVGIIVHEIMHVIYYHLYRFHKIPSVYDVLAHHPNTDPEDVKKLPREPDMKVWNYATDYVINWYIRSMERKDGLISLPDSALHAEPETGKIPIDHLEPEVYILDDTGKARKPEEIYVLLLRSGFYQEWIEPEGGQGGGQGESGGEESQSKGQGGAQGQPGDEEGDGGGRFDEHIYDDSLADEIEKQGGTPNQMDRKDWDVVVNKAANMSRELDKMAGRRGTNAGGKYGVEIDKGKTDWRSVLKKYMEASQSAPPIGDWTRPRKKPMAAGAYYPRTKRDIRQEVPHVIVAIDTSGSTMGDQPRFLGEIVKLLPLTKAGVRVLLWDTVVGNDITITMVNNRPMWGETGKRPTNQLNVGMPFEVTGGGGTSLSSVAEYIAQQKPVVIPKVIIYLTDGYVENNPKMVNKAANLVVLTPGGSDAPFRGKSNTTIVNMD